MPGQTTLDELVVKVGLDPSGFRQGQQQVGDALKKTRDEAVARTRDIEDAGKRAAAWFTTLRNEVVGLFGVLLGVQGLKDFITQTARSEQAMGNLSAVIGMSVDQLYLWGETAKRYGGTAEGFAKSLRGMAVAISQFQLTGQSNPTVEWLYRMFGADAAGMINRIHEVGVQSEDLFKIIEKLQKLNPADQAAAGGALGFSPADMDMLRQGVAEIVAMQNKIRPHGLMSEEDVKRGTEFNQAMLSAQQAMQTLGFALFNQVEPALKTGLDHLTGWIDALRQNKENVQDIVHVLEGLVTLKAAPWVLRLLGIPSPIGGALSLGAGASYAAGKAAEEAARSGSYIIGPEGQMTPVPPGTAAGPSVVQPDATPSVPGWKPGAGYMFQHWWRRGIQPRQPVPPEGMPGLGPAPNEPWDLPHRRARGGSPVTDVVSLLREGLISKDWQKQAGLWGTSGATPRGTRGDPLFTQPARDETSPFNQLVAQDQLSNWGWWGHRRRMPGWSDLPQQPGAPGAGAPPIQPPSSVFGPGAPVTKGGETGAAFVRAHWAEAVEAGKATGIDPRIVMAQAVLESNWGRSAPGNNYFGIKGPGHVESTMEYVPGQGYVRKQQSFAGYGSARESFAGYAAFLLRNPRYRALLAAHGVEQQLEELQRSGYATDPRYAEKLRKIIQQIPNIPQGPDPAIAHATRPGASATTTHHHAPVDNSSSVETHIGTVNVHTQATDAQGIAQGIGPALKRYVYVSQANYGLA